MCIRDRFYSGSQLLVCKELVFVQTPTSEARPYDRDPDAERRPCSMSCWCHDESSHRGTGGDGARMVQGLPGKYEFQGSVIVGATSTDWYVALEIDAAGVISGRVLPSGGAEMRINGSADWRAGTMDWTADGAGAVSYTHLTLPTKRIV
eukprot:TRINITY_DN5348_c0_g1_i1.p1 TRINITY_DN5348_c0_g1~~TRINITY_DN5348_c0_g1_i1.p1  ORF type:complete len:149 (+),score=15.93 TRINITY_DN5348_c0_g1_i1:82-528(+)